MFDTIRVFENPKRRHVRDSMLSPSEFERKQKLNRVRLKNSVQLS